LRGLCFYGLKCFRVAATTIGHFRLKVTDSDITYLPQKTWMRFKNQ
jgi:hypothetical protein